MEDAKCAHKKILGKTTKPDTNGLIKDYWICSDCGTEMRIEPVITKEYFLIDKETALEVGVILSMIIQSPGCSPFIKQTTHNYSSGLHITDCVPDDFK